MDFRKSFPRNREVLAGLFWMSVGAAVAFTAFGYRLGTPGRPGPGFLPFCTGATLILLGTYLTADSLRSPPRTPVFFEQRGSLRRVIITFLSFLAYIFLVSAAGFIVSTAVWTAFLLRSVHPQSWTRTIVFSTAVTVLSYVVFQHLLGVQMPRGIMSF